MADSMIPNVTFGLPLHAAFVADKKLGFMLKPVRRFPGKQLKKKKKVQTRQL